MINFVFRLCTIWVLCLFFCAGVLSAQWRGDGIQRSEHCIQLQGLSHIPELHTDMPLDCLIGYVAMDSIARNVGTFEATRYPGNALIPQLRVLSRYMYAMADYDPILLNRHFLSTMDSSFPNERYRSYPANAYFPVIMEIHKRQAEFGREYGMLVVANYVLRVRVIDVREGIDSTMFDPSHHRLNANVACEVLEVFKGQRLPENCYEPYNMKGGSEESLTQSDCLIYGYIPKDNERRTELGDEMFIFLNLVIVKDNLFGIYPRGGFNKTLSGRFLVRDGRVEDPDNVWGKGINPTLEEFRSTLLQKITDIRSWRP